MSALDDKMKELSARFVARAPEYSATIAKAAEQGDRDAVIEESHRLAGIAGMFGHPAVGKAALALENAARAGGDYSEEAATLIVTLEQL